MLEVLALCDVTNGISAELLEQGNKIKDGLFSHFFLKEFFEWMN